jgi:Tol biopolymer transport system component
MSGRRRTRWRIVGSLAIVGVLVASIAPANATFPDQPARIRFMRILTNHELFVMRTDGTGIRRVTNNSVNDADARVSPDGTRIVFWREPADGSDGEIYTMWTDGTHVRRLTDNDDEDQMPNWSPDGTHIVFRSDRAGFQIDLFRMNDDGTGVTRLTFTNNRERWPTWSPDGAWIAFTVEQLGADTEVARIRPNGSGFQLLTNNTGIDDFTADWAPDGSTLAVWSDVDGDFEIYTLPAAGGTLHRVTQNTVDDVNAFWLPSGKRIVFNRNDGHDLEIHSIRPDGTLGKRLTTNERPDYLVRLVS